MAGSKSCNKEAKIWQNTWKEVINSYWSKFLNQTSLLYLLWWKLAKGWHCGNSFSDYKIFSAAYSSSIGCIAYWIPVNDFIIQNWGETSLLKNCCYGQQYFIHLFSNCSSFSLICTFSATFNSFVYFRQVLCKSHPVEFASYFHYCHSLTFDMQPDYGFLKRLFRDLFTREGLSKFSDSPNSWTLHIHWLWNCYLSWLLELHVNWLIFFIFILLSNN